MSQRRKNVKLIMALGALVIVAVALHLGVNPKKRHFFKQRSALGSRHSHR
jgi:hypothetical protein